MAKYIKERYGLLIDGQWVDAQNGETFVTTNPASGEQLAVCANASPADVDRAVQAARKAFPAWAAKSPAERAALLLKIADKIDERAQELAAVETQDNGKPIRETTLVDVPLSSDHFRYFAGCLRADEGEAVMIDENSLSMVLREPIGVVGQIIPWNFPLLMGAWKIAPALAAGNTVVIKSSSTTPLSLLVLGKFSMMCSRPVSLTSSPDAALRPVRRCLITRALTSLRLRVPPKWATTLPRLRPTV